MQDLSKIGAPKPPPKGAPKRVKSARKKLPAKAMLVVVAVAVVGGALFYLVAGGEKSGVHGPPASYCNAAGHLSSLLAGIVPETGQLPAHVTADTFKVLVTNMGDDLGAVSKHAPGNAKSDARVVVSGVRAAAAGDLNAVRSAAFRRAQVSVLGPGNPCLQRSDAGTGA